MQTTTAGLPHPLACCAEHFPDVPPEAAVDMIHRGIQEMVASARGGGPHPERGDARWLAVSLWNLGTATSEAVRGCGGSLQ